MKERGEISVYFFTGRLNQDCVENLFSIIRGKGGKIPVDTCQDSSNQLIINMLKYVKLTKTIYLFVVNLIMVIKISSFYK